MHSRTSGALGQGVPAQAIDVATVGAPLLEKATRMPADVVLRAGLVWPVLQHAAWLWRVAEPGDPQALTWALSLQLRSDMFSFLELALQAYDLGQRGAPAGRAYPRVRYALQSHLLDEDDLSALPPTLPAEAVLGEALERWSREDIPGDLLVKCQLFTAVTYARLDGFTQCEIVDVFAVILDDLVPQILRTYGT